MGQLISRKIRASSLLEVLIAMVIIMIVFSLAIGIYAKVTASGFSLSDKQIEQEMQRIVAESKKTGDWRDDTFTSGDITYRKAVGRYKDYSDLYLLEVEALKAGKSVGRVREIVKKTADENAG